MVCTRSSGSEAVGSVRKATIALERSFSDLDSEDYCQRGKEKKSGKGRQISQRQCGKIEWKAIKNELLGEDVSAMEFSGGNKMTYTDEAMIGVTASSELARLEVSRPRW